MKALYLGIKPLKSTLGVYEGKKFVQNIMLLFCQVRELRNTDWIKFKNPKQDNYLEKN